MCTFGIICRRCAGAMRYNRYASIARQCGARLIKAGVFDSVEQFTICPLVIDAIGGLWQLLRWPEKARSMW